MIDETGCHQTGTVGRRYILSIGFGHFNKATVCHQVGVDDQLLPTVAQISARSSLRASTALMETEMMSIS